jgi:DUF2075 family protein
MSRSARKSQVRHRMKYTGETYQQAFLETAGLHEGEPLIPDAAGPAQRMVESAVLHRLLHGAQPQWPGGDQPPFPLFVQAVSPSAAGLRLVVPIDEVAAFGAALAIRGADDDGDVPADVITVRCPDNGPLIATAADAADASVALQCSWKRLRTGIDLGPRVSAPSALSLRFGATGPLPLTTGDRAVLSSLLRRSALFADPAAFQWLRSWHRWVTNGRAGPQPEPPADVVSALTRTCFSLAPAQLRALGIDQSQAPPKERLTRRLDEAPGTPTPPSPERISVPPAGVVASLAAETLFGAFKNNSLPAELQALGRAIDWFPSPVGAAAFLRGLSMLAEDLVMAGRGNVHVLIGYQLPLTSRRVHAIVAGTDPLRGHDSYVVVEFKDWSRAGAYEGSDTLVDVPNAPGPLLHPGVQVGDYCRYLVDFLGALADRRVTTKGLAYLHDAIDEDVAEVLERPATDQSRIFTKQYRRVLVDYLRTTFDETAPGIAAADRLVNSTVRSSRNLLTYAARELTERSHFTLLDEQHVAHEIVLNAVDRALSADHKTIVMVDGGPGSGKSTIALRLLGDLGRQGRTALHATGSKSFTQTLRRHAGRGSTRLKSLFLYFNSFMTAEPNGVDVLICDEAHRIRETSVNRFTLSRQRGNARSQLDELIDAARVPVFFLDEHQVVKPGEVGSIERITAHAKKRDIDVEVVSLHDQFRYGGSEAFEEWVPRLLGLHGEEPPVWESDGRFDLRTAESPEQLEAFLAAKQAAGESARMTAGYCWGWSDPRPDDALIDDVRIGSWARPWNAKSDRSVGEAPGSPFWATDPKGFAQVGMVYTAQGFEYEWSGVIIGPDLVARDGRLVTNREEFKDPNFRSRKTVSDAEADRLIRNTYKVLMTRGMRGTILYSTDAETRAFLAQRIPRTA